MSPFTSDKSAVNQANIARWKEDYVIDPEKIERCLWFFRKVENRVMANIELDQETLNKLPKHDLSPHMVVVDSLGTSNVTKGVDEDIPESLKPNSELKQDNCGGSCLSRTYEENETSIFISSTVTIGAIQQGDLNPHEQVAGVLDECIQQRNTQQGTDTYFKKKKILFHFVFGNIKITK